MIPGNNTDSKESENCKYDFSVCVLASGSRGNGIYVSDGETSVLVDSGLSGIEIQRRLASRDLSPENIDAILVTHEHSDHIGSVGILSRRFDVPVYISEKTFSCSAAKLGKLKKVVTFECGVPFDIKSLKLHPFSISHDAEDPAGFTIRHNGSKIGIATDLGVATSMVKTHLQNCNLLILEANHDPVMLTEGPYPWPLKQRVRGRTGHLSNEESRDLVDELKHDDLSHVVLAHLSEENNTPDIALQTVAEALENTNIKLLCASQDVCSEILYIRSKN